MNEIADLIGKHVSWTKLEGKSYASMLDKKGFGCLSVLQEEYRMHIYGDYGVSTSPVRTIEFTDDGIKVTTMNSVYLLKVW
jgi:hypothetical protein